MTHESDRGLVHLGDRETCVSKDCPPRDTYLGVIFVCTCCETRMSECKCPCERFGCNNRVATSIERFFYDMGPIVDPPPSFVRLDP